MLKTRFLNIFRSIFKIPFLEKILSNATQGKSKSSFLSKLPLNYTNYSSHSFRHVERNGIKYHLDISDYMEWLVYFGIEFEPRSILYSLIKPHYTIFDIGTNIGEVAMNMAKRTEGRVHAFEPDPLTAAKFKNNLHLNDFGNIVFNEIGLGDARGSFFMSPEVKNNKGGNRIIHDIHNNHHPKVHVVTLDAYVEENGINQLHLIKIDVEGFELNVLKGGVKTIEKFRPTLFIEVNDRNLRQQGSTAQELMLFLKNYYTKFRYVNGDYDVETPPKMNDCHFDIIAYSDED
ncbi:MAG: FkbM family methyltransferase [Candidatus Cyclobacteriaceae bacterium M2_1C_046]